jgi:hypothetical protein
MLIKKLESLKRTDKNNLQQKSAEDSKPTTNEF